MIFVLGFGTFSGKRQINNPFLFYVKMDYTNNSSVFKFAWHEIFWGDFFFFTIAIMISV